MCHVMKEIAAAAAAAAAAHVTIYSHYIRNNTTKVHSSDNPLSQLKWLRPYKAMIARLPLCQLKVCYPI